MPLNIVIFYGSVRSVRQGIKAARFITERCRARGHETTLVDPEEFSLPLLDKRYKDYDAGEVPDLLERLQRIVDAADAYIVVTAEYNHTPPPALTNLLDHFVEEYFRKPSAIVCYSAGAFGGVRAAMSLRCMLAALGMSSIPSLLPVPRVQSQFSDDGKPKEDQWFERADRFLAELEWYGDAMKAARNKPCDRSQADAPEK